MSAPDEVITTGSDVIAFLKAQHERVKALFEAVLAAAGPAREESFRELRRMLAVHETAEEEIVHPAAKSVLPNGDAIVAQRLREENEAKKVLVSLEKMDVASSEFSAKLRELQAAVIKHADSEEREEFARLADKLDESRLTRMRTAVKFAESVAPTRPHPGVESRAANLMAGPFAAMLDRARDAMTPPHR